MVTKMTIITKTNIVFYETIKIIQKWKRQRMGFIDIHSHILPGVDDGSRSMEESLEMLRIAEAEGVSCMIA